MCVPMLVTTHTVTMAGTRAVMVTFSSVIAVRISSGLVVGANTTFPPISKVPNNPGQQSGKLCATGSAAR